MSAQKLDIYLGSSAFREMATEGSVFVDKSFFIKEIIDYKDKAILITHPRRSGKTSNLDMVKTFFEPEPNPECLSLRYYNPFRTVKCNNELFKSLKLASALDKNGNNLAAVIMEQTS